MKERLHDARDKSVLENGAKMRIFAKGKRVRFTKTLVPLNVPILFEIMEIEQLPSTSPTRPHIASIAEACRGMEYHTYEMRRQPFPCSYC
jgi:hypothetical protein